MSDGDNATLEEFADTASQAEEDTVAEAAAVAEGEGNIEGIVDPQSARYPAAETYLEIAVTQVDYTVEGRGDEEFPVVHVFGRTDGGDAEHVRVLEVEPYFYVPIDEVDDVDPVAEFDPVLDVRETDGDGEPFESIRGTQVAKIVTQTPRDVGQIRDEFDETFEADVLFPNRFLVDRGIMSGMRVPARRLEDGTVQVPVEETEPAEVVADPRVQTFDIEVDDRSGFPEDGEEPIVCLTSHDSRRDEYVAWHYQAPQSTTTAPSSLPTEDRIDTDAEVDIRSFDTEEAMLEAFLDYIDETNPDVLTGWNCLPADSAIQLADGGERAIQDISIGDEVIGSTDGQPTVATVTNKWESEKPIYEFELEDGSSLRSSGDHRVMVKSGESVEWKQGGEIEPGDAVLKPRTLTVAEERVPTHRELLVQGAAELGGGSIDDQIPTRAGAGVKGNQDAADYRTASAPQKTTLPPFRADGGLQSTESCPKLDASLTAAEAYHAGRLLADSQAPPINNTRWNRAQRGDQTHGSDTSQSEAPKTAGSSRIRQDTVEPILLQGLGIPIANETQDAVDISQIYTLPPSFIERFLAGVIDENGQITSPETIEADSSEIARWYVKLFKRLGIYAHQVNQEVRLSTDPLDQYRLYTRVRPHLQSSTIATELAKIGESSPDQDQDSRWREYVFVDVEDVGQTESEITYDIETTTHNFFAEDCLVHNCDDFDIPYYLDRCNNLNDSTDRNLNPDRLSRVNEVWRSGWGGPNVKGRVVFDLLYAYQRTKRSELDSYRLDDVGAEELGVRKERYEGDLGDLWEQDPAQLLAYNVRDVELCVELDRQQGIVAFWNEARRIVGCKLEDATTPGDAVDVYVLHKAAGNFALPSKGQQDAEEFEGGAVFDPIMGVRENVAVLDLKSLYPMSMVTINASPETKVDPDEYEGETYRTPSGVHFRKEPDGIIREMVDELLGEREEKKARRDDHDPGTDAYERYDRQQAAVKVIMNSLYGVFGWDRFRLYDREMSAGVTSTNREVISFTESVVDELGYGVVYGDSVTGDRPVVTRSPTGQITVLPIAELFERGTPNEEILLTADGGPVGGATPGKERRTVDGWEALTINETDEASWEPIDAVIRHDTNKSAVRLEHPLGESVTTTDHSYIIEDSGQATAPPEEVTTPLRVPGIPPVERETTVDMSTLLGSGLTPSDLSTGDSDILTIGDTPSVRIPAQIELDGSQGVRLSRVLGIFLRARLTTGQTDPVDSGEIIVPGRSRERLESWKQDYEHLVDGGTAHIEHHNEGADCLRLTDTFATRCDEAVFGADSEVDFPSIIYHLPESRQRDFLCAVMDLDSPGLSDLDSLTLPTIGLAGAIATLLNQVQWDFSIHRHKEGDGYVIRGANSEAISTEPRVTSCQHDGAVYDLSVGESEAFVDAVGGLVLHNTDSVMLELGSDVDQDSAIEQAFELESQINERYDDFATERLGATEHRFEIEFEKLYRRFFQAGKKKRYAGHVVWEEGAQVDEVDITGFEYTRSDIAPITKEVQREVIERIVYGEDIADIEAYLHEVIEDFRAGNVDVEAVGIPGGIGKRLNNYETDTAHVRGAKYANLVLGTNFGRGSKPKRLYLDKVHPDFFADIDADDLDETERQLLREFRRDPDVICIEYADQLPESFSVDWDKMLEKTLKGPIERILEALDISWEEVKSGQTQTGLGNFM